MRTLSSSLLYAHHGKHPPTTPHNMSPATVYSVGPSVQDVADILDLLQSVIPPQPGREFKDSVICGIRSLVPFISSWILERGVLHAKRRPGSRCVNLWCVFRVRPSSDVVQVWTVGFLRFVEDLF